MTRIDTIVFDLGGVLIDWNPRYLYRKLFETEDEVTWFLENVCTPEWNEKQDGGRTFSEAIEELSCRFPIHDVAIRAWFSRWPETIGGPIQETVDILQSLHEQKQYRLYALTNWSAETFPWAKSNFDFLHWFEGIVVSGEEKSIKPNLEFYRILLERYGINPNHSIFIDDNLRNVDAAKALGMDAIHFVNPAKLRTELQTRELKGL